MTNAVKAGRGLRYVFGLLATIAVAACASAQTENMIPQLSQVAVPTAASKTVRIVVTAPTVLGYDALVIPGEPPPQSQITDDAFREALRRTLEESELFKSVQMQGNTDYELHGLIFSQQITNGWHYSGTIGARYKLIDTASGKTKWQDSIVSDCYSDKNSIMGVSSTSDATECAMRKNLSQLADKLSKLSL